MLSRKTDRLPLFMLIAVICITLTACYHSNRQQEPQIAAFVPLPTPTAGPPDVRQPHSLEVSEAIKRVYGQTVTIESGRNQYFIAGDFNGDASPDLAVVVKPAVGSLVELNHDLANWIRCDPHKVTLPNPKQRVHHFPATTAEAVNIEQNDVLLAIVHGYGPPGWRNPQARQSYLLKNAAGLNMKLLSSIETIKMTKSSSNHPPRPRGDVVKQTLAGEYGLIYYTGAKYTWHRL